MQTPNEHNNNDHRTVHVYFSSVHFIKAELKINFFTNLFTIAFNYIEMLKTKQNAISLAFEHEFGWSKEGILWCIVSPMGGGGTVRFATE